MNSKTSALASETFSFRADLEVECFDDNFDIEVEQSALQIDKNGSDVYASFEALVILTDLENPNNKAHIRFGVQRLRLFNLEKSYSCNASSDAVIVERSHLKMKKFAEDFTISSMTGLNLTCTSMQCRLKKKVRYKCNEQSYNRSKTR